MRGLLLIPALVAVAFVYATIDSDSGIRTWWHMRGVLGASRSRIAEIRREIRVLERDAGELEGDPFAIERAIREDLKLARRGEQIVRISASTDSNPRFP